MSDAERMDQYPAQGGQSVPESAPVRRRLSNWPPISTAIIAICILMAVAGRIQPQVTVELMFYPPLASEQPYRFFTSAVLHSGFWHLAFNMYALWLVGRVLEPAFGAVRFILLYVLAAFGGNVAIMLLSNLTGEWNIGAVGASGAIFGLFGALAILYKRMKANMSGILAILGINLVLGFVVQGISWESHLGGLVVGILLTWLWIGIGSRFQGKREYARLAADIGVALLLFAAMVGLLLI